MSGGGWDWHGDAALTSTRRAYGYTPRMTVALCRRSSARAYAAVRNPVTPRSFCSAITSSRAAFTRSSTAF